MEVSLKTSIVSTISKRQKHLLFIYLELTRTFLTQAVTPQAVICPPKTDSGIQVVMVDLGTTVQTHLT